MAAGQAGQRARASRRRGMRSCALLELVGFKGNRRCGGGNLGAALLATISEILLLF